MSLLHDTVRGATGESLSEEALLAVLAGLPDNIKKEIEEWGLLDTEVRDHIWEHLQRVKVAAPDSPPR